MKVVFLFTVCHAVCAQNFGMPVPVPVPMPMPVPVPTPVPVPMPVPVPVTVPVGLAQPQAAQPQAGSGRSAQGDSMHETAEKRVESPLPGYGASAEDAWTDGDFPAGDGILNIASEERPAMSGGVKWVRAADMGDDLFKDDMGPNTPGQGAIGDCWLLAAMSSASTNHGELIRGLFIDSDVPRGYHKLRFFDVRLGSEGDWTEVEVDDLLPCTPGGDPLFARSTTGSLWPMILEKAFAKFVGDYNHLISGQSVFAWQAWGLCRSSVWIDHRDDDFTIWHNEIEGQRQQMQSGDRRAMNFRGYRETMEVDKLWSDLSTYEHLLAEASCCREGDHTSWGLVSGHAYSLLNAMEVSSNNGDNFRLVRLRNPWATDENGNDKAVWQGDWGENSPTWDQYPEIIQAVNDRVGGDSHDGQKGVFWMSFDDFRNWYDGVEMCNYGEDGGKGGREEL